MTTTDNSRLTGHAAIDFAREHDLPLSKHADPMEGARDDLTVAEAEDVAREDASLIWLEPLRCVSPEYDQTGDEPYTRETFAAMVADVFGGAAMPARDSDGNDILVPWAD